MGFTNKEVNIAALKATMGNVEAAVERILNMIGN
jgi:ubiquilin